MSSTIFYKFLHQKVKSTIHFDGTGISVFDLKHEIIIQNGLGAGTDFNLRLYHQDAPDQEYENDQDVIPRSSFVLARRLPAGLRNGKFNNAVRYISGKPRISKKVTNNPVANTSEVGGLGNNGGQSVIDENILEEDRIKMMFENQLNAWAQTQDELSTHKMVYSKPSTNGSTNPEDQPPPGYMCYRCGGKDHWIRNCPTNTDPNYEGKKIKRTTGIPKSYLKTISREAANYEGSSITTNENGDLVDAQGNIYMVTDNGEYVLALADSKTWNSYQEKQQKAVNQAQHEYESKIIECIQKEGLEDLYLNPLSETKKILKAPIVMTPCCQDKLALKKLKNYNYHQPELEKLLIENDFHCPNCNSEDVFLDTLIKNEALEKEISEFIEKKSKELEIEDPSQQKRSAEEAEMDANGSNKRQNTAFPAMPFMPGMPLPMLPFMPPPPPGTQFK